ncbi:MAG: undecaprenyl-diphosphate phosphatase [Syntrophales bacterium]|nr:undecaprenyl-diphosphate phosphatase [Syntrophales bacterium]
MDLLLLLKAALLGIVEGVTEFIPVSSTGHLILTQDWLAFSGRKENAFIIFIQFGAILAVIWLYRMKFIDIVRNLHREPAARNLVLNLVIGTLPAVVVGLPTEKWIEAHLFRPVPVAVAFVLGGLAILMIERCYKTPDVESVDRIPMKKALGVGLIQVLAIIFPGTSRSGATIMGGLALGLSRTAATEFSFFLAIPAMLGASIIKLFKVRELLSAADIPSFMVGFVVSFLSALFVIRRLLTYVSRKSFAPFAWYRIVFGLLLLIFYWNRNAF